MKDLYALFRQSLAGLRLLLAATLLARRRLSRCVVTGFGQVAAPWQAPRLAGHRRRQPHHRRRRGGRLRADRPAGRRPGPVPAAALGRRRRLRHAVDVRLQLRAGGARPDRRRSRSARPRSPSARASPTRDVPPDAVTASGSGLDPDISVAYADLQVPRVAAANGLSEDAGARPGRRQHLGPDLGRPRRAARQRAAAQHRRPRGCGRRLSDRIGAMDGPRGGAG